LNISCIFQPTIQLVLLKLNAEEDAVYEEFDNNLLNHYNTSAMGWVVGLRKALLEEGKAKIQNTKL